MDTIEDSSEKDPDICLGPIMYADSVTRGRTSSTDEARGRADHPPHTWGRLPQNPQVKSPPAPSVALLSVTTCCCNALETGL